MEPFANRGKRFINRPEKVIKRWYSKRYLLKCEAYNPIGENTWQNLARIQKCAQHYEVKGFYH